MRRRPVQLRPRASRTARTRRVVSDAKCRIELHHRDSPEAKRPRGRAPQFDVGVPDVWFRKPMGHRAGPARASGRARGAKSQRRFRPRELFEWRGARDLGERDDRLAAEGAGDRAGRTAGGCCRGATVRAQV